MDPPPVSKLCTDPTTVAPGSEFMETPSLELMWCDADKELALQIVALCEKPPSKKPREPGQRAIVAIARRPHFSTDEGAWSAYGSSMQRFYEWKPAVDAALAASSCAIPSLMPPVQVQETPDQGRASEAAEARAKQLHAEAQARFRKRQREAAELAAFAQEAETMELPPAVTWAREEQISRDDFVGSEAEWQHHVEGEERRLAAWLKWIEHREALIEAMSAAYLYHIAEARGRRRETLLEAASSGKTVGCACGAAKPGCCNRCENHGGMVLYRELGGDSMHRYRLEGVGLHWSRFVHVGQEAEIMYPDDGWGRMSCMASLNKMIKQMSSWDESVPLPAHPDAELWRVVSENGRVQSEEWRAWRASELAAGRDGLTKLERDNRDWLAYTGCEHCGSRYCKRGARCPSNPSACPCVQLPYRCEECRGK